MERYFEAMLPAEELEQLKFIPTISEFVEWMEKKWHDLPALSDTISTCTYAKMCNDIAHKRALLNNLGLQKGDKVAILDNSTPDAVEMFLAQVNTTLPSTHRIAKLTVRKEDFKRTGTLKVSRN